MGVKVTERKITTEIYMHMQKGTLEEAFGIEQQLLYLQ
jgi:hypothetical protein